MKQIDVDVAIVGAGTAGLTARRAARAAGARPLMVDAGPLGTTCARVGCMPSKLLIAAATVAHQARAADIFGLRATVEVDGPRVLERVQRERDRFVGFVLRSIDEARAAGEMIDGRARFAGPETLVVDDHTEVHAKAFVLAAGTRPVTPPPFRGLGDRLLCNETVFELTDLPRSLLVVGAGVIGLELGQAFRRLGADVTVVDLLETVGPLRDPRCVDSARGAFADELSIHLGYQLQRIERVGDAVVCAFRDGDGASHERHFDYVLMAAGRVPDVGQLQLDRTGFPLDERGVPRCDPLTMQVGESPLFLAGDITGDRPVLHEAADEGRIAGRNAARFPQVSPGERRCPLAIVFTEPQLAVVGLPAADFDGALHAAGEVDYGDQGRARVMNENRGLVRVYGERGSGRLLGAEMVGPRVEHTAHLLAWAIQRRLTVTEALALPFYHPVVEEGIRTALRDLRRRLG